MATDQFQTIIQEYLNNRAVEDTLFAETLKKPNKNIKDCITYILNEVKKSGRQGFADDEIFGMAVHYYDEDEIKVGSAVTNVKIVTNKSDKGKSKEAKKEEAAEPKKKSKKEILQESQISLFEF